MKMRYLKKLKIIPKKKKKIISDPNYLNPLQIYLPSKEMPQHQFSRDVYHNPTINQIIYLDYMLNHYPPTAAFQKNTASTHFISCSKRSHFTSKSLLHQNMNNDGLN
jgi:hypothetical protein